MSKTPARFKCYLVEAADNRPRGSIVDRPVNQLPAGDVMIQVRYSALNYKDGLAATGHPGVALQLPLVPGIDAAGIVLESGAEHLEPGDEVFVSAADFGTRHWGGWSELVNVPADWCYKVPDQLSDLDVVGLGTAGFTAAQSVEQLQLHNVTPDSGPVVVSGATGGVGVFAVMLLSRLGYSVVASTGKPEQHDWLRRLGANEIVSREELNDSSNRPLLSSRWAAGIDTVGGNTLSTMLRSIRPAGCVTACGLVAGHELNLTVYPFILRGVCLQGIDSANISRTECQRIWNRLNTDFKLDNIQDVVSRTSLENIQASVDQILNGKIRGRTVVDITSG